jgi:hypothetical protein
MYLSAFFGFVGGILSVVILRFLNIAWHVQPAAQATVDGLAALGERVDRITTLFPESDQTKLVYQQAGDWVRMVNTITWTLGSIYLAGSFIVLNAALGPQLIDKNWRPLIGLAVVCLCVIWLVVDSVYLWSVSAARRKLVAIEENWPTKFFKEQENSKFGRYLVVGGLYLSMGLPFFLGLAVARPWLPSHIQALLPDISQAF